MDYTDLARDLLYSMNQLRKKNIQKRISDSMHGEPIVLFYISKCEGDVIPSEISNEMGISTARVAVTLNSLESKGLITRRIDKNDRRRILVEITPAGEERVNEHGKMMLENMKNMLTFLGEHDAFEYARIMKRLAERPADKSEDGCRM